MDAQQAFTQGSVDALYRERVEYEDGNLVVTLVPALAVGLTGFGLALRRFRHGGSK